MNKNIILIVSTFLIVFMTVMAGCSGKSLHTSSSEDKSRIEKVDMIESSNLKTNIDEYTVVDENKPLKIKQLCDESFNSLQKELDTHGQFGKGGMELAVIDYKYSVGDLRKVKIENKTMYYCGFSDMDDKTRIYAFFWKLNEWSCYDYVKVKMNSLKKGEQQNDDIIKSISLLDLQ